MQKHKDKQTTTSPVTATVTVAERQKLAKYLRQTPVGAISSQIQNRLIQILEQDSNLEPRPVSSIQGYLASPTDGSTAYKEPEHDLIDPRALQHSLPLSGREKLG